ncbi:hypothetical protein C2W62_19960 [Candidatus Entotheonella serta]|nr:hypothetical protein C2W62_19960 [Candidatus Entotheonella serta]
MATPSDFASIDSFVALNTLLTAAGVDTSRWGRENTKSVDDLWAEIAAGESRIRTQPLLRVVAGAVSVLIRRGSCMLIETRQVFASGMIRQRNIPPAEKMLPGERPIDAAIRCLSEELGVMRHDIESVASMSPPRHEVSPSPSYPGLLTSYTFHTVEARVQGLPDHDFVTHEYDTDGQAWIIQHNWAWQRV